MLIMKGSVLGFVFFGVFLFLWFYQFMHRVGQPITAQFIVSPATIKGLTVANPLFWSALLICFGVAFGIVGMWHRASN